MSTPAQRYSKVALVAGFLALTAAIWFAHQHPATGYELSIYAATPTPVWVGLGVATAAGGVVALTAPRAGRTHDASLMLVAASALVVFALPLLRGYEFYGGGDSLTHLGWASEIAAGTLSPTELLYPGLHTMTVVAANVAGLPLRQANLYLVLVAFPLVFLCFVPLTVQLLGGGRRALAVGLLAAVLFAPINNISVHPVAHPASQGIMFFAFVTYVFLAYTVAPGSHCSGTTDRAGATNRGSVLRTDGGSRFGRVTSLGVLLGLTSAAIVLLHPQQALNVAIVFVTVAVLQAVYRRWRSNDPVVTHRPVYAQTALLIALFALWAPRFERVSGTVRVTFGSILREGATAGTVVSQKSASLTTVGGSLVALFLKLFLPALVLSIVAAVFVAVVLWRRNDDSNQRALVTYLAAALVPLFGVFLLMLAANVGDQYFRYQGFIMVPVTVLAATALARFTASLDASSGRRTGTVLAVVLFLVLVPAGAVAVHPSPYMYQPSSQVTETDFSGYAASFEHRDTEIPFVGVRSGPRRFVDYYYGTEYATETLDFPGERTGIGEELFARANYSTAFEVPRYFAITRSTYEKEVMLYDGFRYPASGFAALDATVGVDRVRSSDAFTLYRLPGEE